jgi:hypothetical protein
MSEITLTLSAFVGENVLVTGGGVAEEYREELRRKPSQRVVVVLWQRSHTV